MVVILTTLLEADMRVCIDAGHGGRDSGAVGTKPFVLEEKTVNLAISLLLEQELRAKGHEVVMTRRRDWYVSLEARADFANRLGVDFFVSIHANASYDPATEGMEVFHFPGGTISNRYARNILTSMLRQFPDHIDRGVKEANFAVLRLTNMPAVLVECEFITNPQQLRFLSSSNRQAELARAIAIGIHTA
ncbi:MAG: N-acetylmuramoyl-L-alanine amidase family protein [Candidatus Oleimicrobiaceae bacterium]